MKRILIILLALACVTNSRACLNYYYSLDKNGHVHPADNILIPFNKNFNKELNVSRLRKLETRLKKERSHQVLSDYSITLLKLGKNKEALEILVTLYNHFPNEYKIAANLGTAYELNGQADSALKYIKKGIELNPKSHDGSEWVHIKILETKLIIAKEPGYLSGNRILQLSEKQKQDTVTRKQIITQVRERFPFSPGPDPIMANILVDLGDCYANTVSIEYAKILYTIAKIYYGDKSASTETKIKEMQELIAKYASVQPPKNARHEASNVKMTGFTYKQMIDDNDINHYKVDWSRINTNVKSLVELVNFTGK